MGQSSPGKLYAGVAGAVLVLAGIVGFFYSSDFGSPGAAESMFDIFAVNGWNNVVHILTGAVGLLVFSIGAYAARQYALALGGVYLAVAIWGFIVGDGDFILGIFPVSIEDDVLHLLLGLGGLTTGLAMARCRRS
jgi:hypothetical protein